MKLNLEGMDYSVCVERKNNKNAYIRIRENQTIYVTVPYLYSDKKIMRILEENKKSIARMLKKQEEKQRMEEGIWFLGEKYDYIETSLYDFEICNHKIFAKDKKAVEKYFLKKRQEIYAEHLAYWYHQFEEKIPYPKLKIRTMKTRWGVCNRRDNSITLNTELLKYDLEKLDYVIIHELSHFRHFNHSKEFWHLVEKYCPTYKQIRRELH